MLVPNLLRKEETDWRVREIISASRDAGTAAEGHRDGTTVWTAIVNTMEKWPPQELDVVLTDLLNQMKNKAGCEIIDSILGEIYEDTKKSRPPKLISALRIYYRSSYSPELSCGILRIYTHFGNEWVEYVKDELRKSGERWVEVPIQAALLHTKLHLWAEAIHIVEVAHRAGNITYDALHQFWRDLQTFGCPRGLLDVLRRGWKLPAKKSA